MNFTVGDEIVMHFSKIEYTERVMTLGGFAYGVSIVLMVVGIMTVLYLAGPHLKRRRET